MNDSTPVQLAAIDLGSNSFHLTIAREIHGEIQLIDRLGEKVQLASGLDENNHLSQEAIDRGLACLERFAQRLGGINEESIQVVGTNTLRAAHNRNDFIEPAEELLGVPVQIISGREEARLVYLGVAHSYADDGERRLVIDIGGGSTEFIIGERFSPIQLESLHMGCVSYTRRFFADGKLKRESFESAIEAAHLELLHIRKKYRNLGWSDVVGSSGTIKAIYALINKEASNEPIRLKTLHKVMDQILAFENVSDINLDDIKDKRAAVIPGGLAILIAAFESLDIENMGWSDGALREGLFYDHVGRQNHEDVRERTINALMERYHVNTEQAKKIEDTALYCLSNTSIDKEKNQNLLSWASRLHEIGLAISHSRFQKHGAYLIENSDLMGFNRDEQAFVGFLVNGHRRKLPMEEIESLPKKQHKRLLKLMTLLRFSVILHHSIQIEEMPEFDISMDEETLQVRFPKNWLDEHPLTNTDLKQEKGYLKAAGITLDIK